MSVANDDLENLMELLEPQQIDTQPTLTRCEYTESLPSIYVQSIPILPFPDEEEGVESISFWLSGITANTERSFEPIIRERYGPDDEESRK